MNAHSEKTITAEKVVEMLNDLIAINNERMIGYEQASFQSHIFNLELRRTFALFANLSRQNIYELRQDIIQLQTEPVRLVATGEIFAFWENMGASFDLKDSGAALSACIAGERAIQAAYVKTLGRVEGTGIRKRVIENLTMQSGKLQTAGQIIQQYNPSTVRR